MCETKIIPMNISKIRLRSDLKIILGGMTDLFQTVSGTKSRNYLYVWYVCMCVCI